MDPLMLAVVLEVVSYCGALSLVGSGWTKASLLKQEGPTWCSKAGSRS